MSHVFLVGFMGSGKSTVGRLAAGMLGLPCIDLDEEVERVTGRAPARIFAEDGEPAFRRLESETLRKAVAGPRSVIACGGGVVVDDENRRLLKSAGLVAYLKVSADEALARIGDTATRPLLSGDSGRLAASLLQAREALYEAVADVMVDTHDRGAEQVAEALVEVLGRAEKVRDR